MDCARWISMAAVVAAAACGPSGRPPVPAAPAPAAPVATMPVTAERFVDGLRYQVHGDGPVTIVLVHGNFDRLETWDALVPALAGWARVVALDLPGFGGSENRDDDFSLPALARGVGRVVDAVGADRVVVVGNSFGGGVAATFAAMAPSRIAGLVLEDANFFPGVGPTPEGRRPLMALTDAAAARARAPDDARAGSALRAATRAALEVALRRPGVVTDALVEHFAACFEGAGWTAVQRVARDVDYEPLPAAFVAAHDRHPFPVLIAWGLDDPMLSVFNAERIARAVDGARLWLIAGTGHAAHLERTAELADAIRAAFAPGGALPTDDVVVVPDGAAATTPWRLAMLPRIERAIRRAVAAGGPSQALEVAPWLAIVELTLGHVDAAEAAAAPLVSSTAPRDAGRLALVRGLVAEARGQPAVEAYLAAAASDEPWTRDTALGRLALADLDPATAATVDAAIGPLADDEPTRRRVARLDRALATFRYEDALAQLAGWSADEPAFGELRQAMAQVGAGRIDEVGELKDVARMPAPDDRFAALRRPLGTCTRALAALARRARGGRELGRPACALPLVAGALADTVPPPRLRDLGAAPDPASPLGAVALAMDALGTQDDAGARAALAAVPAAAATQTPAYHRLRLALAAAAGDRRAVTEARALVAAHGGGWPWRWALATTLAAAGKPADAERELTLVIAVSGHLPAREELARLLAGRGRLAEARAILAALGRRIEWQGMAPLPHERRAVAKLTAPSAPTPPAPPRR